MQVKIVAVEGHSTLVEWVDNGRLHRGMLPNSSIRGEGIVYKRELNRAAPYGIAWEEVVDLQATSELLAQNLRKRGVWTGKDLVDHPEETISAIMETYSVDYQTLVVIATREANK